MLPSSLHRHADAIMRMNLNFSGTTPKMGFATHARTIMVTKRLLALDIHIDNRSEKVYRKRGLPRIRCSVEARGHSSAHVKGRRYFVRQIKEIWSLGATRYANTKISLEVSIPSPSAVRKKDALDGHVAIVHVLSRDQSRTKWTKVTTAFDTHGPNDTYHPHNGRTSDGE